MENLQICLSFVETRRGILTSSCQAEGEKLPLLQQQEKCSQSGLVCHGRGEALCLVEDAALCNADSIEINNGLDPC